MQFGWHAPYADWLREYVEEIGPEGFVDRPAFKRAAARAARTSWSTWTAPSRARRRIAPRGFDVEDGSRARRRKEERAAPRDGQLRRRRGGRADDAGSDPTGHRPGQQGVHTPLLRGSPGGLLMLTATVSGSAAGKVYRPVHLRTPRDAQLARPRAPARGDRDGPRRHGQVRLLREGVRLTTDTDNSTGRKALHSLASRTCGGTMRRLTDALLAHPGIDDILDGDAHGDTALSLAVNKGHTYLALRLLEKGASLTPDAGEGVRPDNA